ncbi:branched-chain amino acid aminotransferase 2, chloroplastic isoform X1 [Cajanus cajan]|uniref:branched-chain amino acid aminotransferase 2, chloroplastic isoform X1 n=1 Tax=Cajanus cajan TaxID=3821 RepID=UPI0010FADE4A|nr:branched-chain amino acid aminotransferase 2, chloroplastic isoform X1 [Cajanus cajan]
MLSVSAIKNQRIICIILQLEFTNSIFMGTKLINQILKLKRWLYLVDPVFSQNWKKYAKETTADQFRSIYRQLPLTSSLRYLCVCCVTVNMDYSHYKKEEIANHISITHVHFTPSSSRCGWIGEKQKMESSAVSARIRLSLPICPSRHSSSFLSSQSPFLFAPSLSLKIQKHFPLTSHNVLEAASPIRPSATVSESYSETFELADIEWDNLGFGLQPTDYMYIMKCARGGTFSKGELQRFGNIELNPSAGVLNYGQGLFEGLKAYRKQDGRILLFRPEENALRLQVGAERMCMPSPTVEQFVEAVKDTVLANQRWVGTVEPCHCHRHFRYFNVHGLIR